MAKIDIEGHGSCEVEEGRRLVLAIESCGVDIGHRCGGMARCTTCRVQFEKGEPEQMTRAEHDKLAERGLLGQVRLSCQILAQDGMVVTPMMRVAEMGWDDPGPPPEPFITPTPEWIENDALDGTP